MIISFTGHRRYRWSALNFKTGQRNRIRSKHKPIAGHCGQGTRRATITIHEAHGATRQGKASRHNADVL